MGNKVSVQEKDRRGHKLPQTNLKLGDVSRTEADVSGGEAPHCQQLEDQNAKKSKFPISCQRKERYEVEEVRIARQQGTGLQNARECDRLFEEQGRRYRQLQKKHAREEMQRKAEEEAHVNRQQLREKLDAVCLQEKQRNELKARPLRLSLPGVCRRYSSRQGCDNSNCRELHICRQFLADICNYGVNCRYGHSLTTAHNQDVCGSYTLDSTRELVLLQQMRSAFQESDQLTEAMFVSNLARCFRFRSKTSCESHECNRIHICRYFVFGACERSDCKYGHDLHTAHNNEVLRRHHLTNKTDDEILRILREREKKRKTQQTGGAAGASSDPLSNPADSGRRISASSSNKTSGTGQPRRPGRDSKGLAEELICPVCLELFNRATTLGCGHTFCADCLQEVRSKNGDKCPLCCANISSTIRSVALDNIVKSVAEKQ